MTAALRLHHIAFFHGTLPREVLPTSAWLYWLLFDAGPLLDQLQVIINEMADKHNTPRFVPHVTIAGPIENKSGEEVLKICSELGTTLPVRLHTECVPTTGQCLTLPVRLLFLKCAVTVSD